MINDGTVIERAKKIKGGWCIQSLFEIFRHRTEIALASKFNNLKRDKIHISFSESFNESGYRGAHSGRETFNKEELDKNGTTKHYEVTVTKRINRNVINGLEPYHESQLRTTDFNEANEFFIKWVNKLELNNDVYLSERYKDKVNNKFKKFDYLTFLRKESKSL
jgi:hypothetical protein